MYLTVSLYQTLLEYDASLDPRLFGLYEIWIEEPSRRKKGEFVDNRFASHRECIGVQDDNCVILSL